MASRDASTFNVIPVLATSALRRLAEEEFSIPSYMFDDALPFSSRLILPSINEVLLYAKAKKNDLLTFNNGILEQHFVITELKEQDCHISFKVDDKLSSTSTTTHDFLSDIPFLTAECKDVAYWNDLRFGMLTIKQWFFRCVSYRINTLLSRMDGVLSIGKFRNTSRSARPIVFDVYIDESKKLDFERDSAHLVSQCNIVYIPRAE